MRVQMIATVLIGGLIAQPALAEPNIREAVDQAKAFLDDPRNARAADAMMGSLTDSLLGMKIGEAKAAAEGRTPTAADKSLTVRDLAKKDDPQFETRLREGAARAGPALRQSLKGMAAAVPALTKSFDQLGKALERIAANLPDPTYPKR